MVTCVKKNHTDSEYGNQKDFSRFVRVKHVCTAEHLETAIKGPETFCDTCKRKGVPKKTANVYCTKCEKKYCATHAEVSRYFSKFNKRA